MTWQPANEGHSIERASISFVFAEALPVKPANLIFSQLENNAKKAGLEFAGNSAPPFQINLQIVGQQVVQQLPSPNTAPGGTFRRFEDGKVLEEVVFDQGGIVFSVYNYDRWADFCLRSHRMLDTCLEIANHTVSVAGVKLEYWDRFDNADEHDGELIAEDSALIGQAQKAMRGSWHTHVGHFLEASDTSRILINANIDVIAASDGMPLPQGIAAQARIYTLGAFQHLDGAASFAGWDDARAELDRLHDILKATLSDLITGKLEERINLRSDRHQS